MPEGQGHGGLGYALRFRGVGGAGLAGVDIAEAAVARTRFTQDQKGGRVRRVTLLPVGAVGGLAHGEKAQVVHKAGATVTTLSAQAGDAADSARRLAQASGAKAEVKFLKPGYSATVNDENLTGRMLPTLQQVTGGKAVVAPKLSASEDFSEFQKKVPGVFFFLGSTDPKRDLKAAAPNHSPKFEIDEASLAVGARAMTALALDKAI